MFAEETSKKSLWDPGGTFTYKKRVANIFFDIFRWNLSVNFAKFSAGAVQANYNIYVKVNLISKTYVARDTPASSKTQQKNIIV